MSSKTQNCKQAFVDAFIPEPTSNLAWPLFGMSAILLYHYGTLSQFNLAH